MIFIIITIILCFIGFFVKVYNSLIKTKNDVNNSRSQISVQLKRRHDLIPNLVETVKGYAQHEKETLQNVIEARQMAVNIASGSKMSDISQAESRLSGALKSLFALAENYPDLKANTNFLALQEELASTENRIAFARQYYNDTVTKYNNNIQIFPNNFISGMFNFVPASFFEVVDEETKVVAVKF